MDNLTFLLEFPIFIVYVCCWDFEQMVYDRTERWISGGADIGTSQIDSRCDGGRPFVV